MVTSPLNKRREQLSVLQLAWNIESSQNKGDLEDGSSLYDRVLRKFAGVLQVIGATTADECP